MITLRWAEIAPEGGMLHMAVARPKRREVTTLHDHDFFECFNVTQGPGWHWVEEARRTVEPGWLVMVRPEHRHAFQAMAEGTFVFTNVALAADAVAVCGSAEALWSEPGEGPRAYCLTRRQQHRCEWLLNDLAGGGRTLVDARYFLAGLERLVAETPGADGVTLPDWLREGLAAAEEEAEVLREGVPRLVRLCGRTPEHVSRSFRHYLECTPTEWLTRQRLRVAGRLLEQTSLPIPEVAAECGMENLSHFHRAFRAYYEETPRRYRQRAGLWMGGKRPPR